MRALSRARGQTAKGKLQKQVSNDRAAAQTTFAVSGGNRWTDEEIELAFSLSLTDAEIAETLGRSRYAVRNVRQRYPERAPIGYKTKQQQRKV
jgi:hypothetical protein